jgi:hypothetical protein
MAGECTGEGYKCDDASDAPYSPLPELTNGCSWGIFETGDGRKYAMQVCPNPLPWHLPWRTPLQYQIPWVTYMWLLDEGRLERIWHTLYPDQSFIDWDVYPA